MPRNLRHPQLFYIPPQNAREGAKTGQGGTNSTRGTLGADMRALSHHWAHLHGPERDKERGRWYRSLPRNRARLKAYRARPEWRAQVAGYRADERKRRQREGCGAAGRHGYKLS